MLCFNIVSCVVFNISKSNNIIKFLASKPLITILLFSYNTFKSILRRVTISDDYLYIPIP